MLLESSGLLGFKRSHFGAMPVTLVGKLPSRIHGEEFHQRYFAIKSPEAECHQLLLAPMHCRSHVLCKSLMLFKQPHCRRSELGKLCIEGACLANSLKPGSKVVLPQGLSTVSWDKALHSFPKGKYLKGPAPFSKGKGKRKFRTKAI